MSSVVVPSYFRFWKKAQFDSLAREIQGLVQYARQQAVANDTTATVLFDPRSQTFIATVSPPAPTTDVPIALQQSDPAMISGAPIAPKGVTLGEDFAVTGMAPGAGQASPTSGGGTEIHFRSDGTCDGAQITLRSGEGLSTQIVIWPATGRVTLEDAE